MAILSHDIKNKLRNSSCLFIKDFNNKSWQLEYDGCETISLSNRNESFGSNILTTVKAISDC